MYNMLFGRNPMSRYLLAMLGLTLESVGRFRDAFVTEDSIAIYTRNGGGNRVCWLENEKPGPECDCVGCIMTFRLPGHPLYIRDQDDSFDSTYATVYFRFPDEWAEFLTLIGKGQKWEPDKRWAEKLEALGAAEPQEPRASPPEPYSYTQHQHDLEDGRY